MQTLTSKDTQAEKKVPSHRSVARRIKQARPILDAAVFIILAAWGVYGLVTVSTSPSTEGLVGDILRESLLYANLQNYTVNGNAYFMAIFQASPRYNASNGWPQYYSVPGGQGVAVGPFLTSEPSSTVVPFVKRFAIFLFEFSHYTVFSYGLIGGANSNGTIKGSWAPQGPLPIDSPFVYHGRAGLRDLIIVQADVQGNYTLYINTPGNLTATGSIGYSSVSFTPSRPFFYFGLITSLVAGIFLSAMLVSYSKRPRDKKPDLKRTQIPEDIPLD